MLVFFEKKIVSCFFFKIKIFMQMGSKKKRAFSKERHYNVGSKMMQN